MSSTVVPRPAGSVDPQGPRSSSAWMPLTRAVLWAAIGGFASAALTMLVQGSGRMTELSIVTSYLGGLVGWVLGVGVWEAVVRPLFGSENTWDDGHGPSRYWRLNSDHKVIGIQYLVTAGFVFLLAGAVAMLMRAELATPLLDVFQTNQQYNAAVGIHGTLMLFAVSVVGIVGGFGNYFVPLMVGADDMVFPRVNAVSYWLVVPGAVAIAASPLVGGIQAGWTGYAPLAQVDAPGQLLYYLGVVTLGTSSLLTAVNVVATTLYKRAPGLGWSRLPMFCWAMLVTSILNLLWVPVVSVGMVMGLLDRVAGTQFFGGDGLSLVWQDIFWLFGHPEVYIIILAAWGLWLEIIPVFARKTLFARRWAIGGFVVVGLMSSLVWTHHMFVSTSNTRLIPFMATTELISVPTGLMYLVVLGTLWRSSVRLTTPMLLVLMSVFNFLIGGITGVFLADVPADYFFSDNYFVVSHFHYVIIGGMIFTWFAGAFYWLPKFSGRMFSEKVAKPAAWLLFITFNATFFQMLIVGTDGMNRRVAVYPEYLEALNLAISAAASVLGLAFLFLVGVLVHGWLRGPAAGPNPWQAKTLEWQTSSPPPHENFDETPVVVADFYGYGSESDVPVEYVPSVSEQEDRSPGPLRGEHS